MKHFVIVLLCSVLFVNCDTKISESTEVYKSIEKFDSDLQPIITNGWKSLGGWEAYESLKSIKYKKRSVLYLEDGTVENESFDTHEMILRPELQGELTKIDSTGIVTKTIYTTKEAYKEADGKRIEGSENSAWSSFLSSHYVLFAPFKLADKGSTVTLEGTRTLPDGTNAYSVKSVSTSDNQHPDGEDDTWYLFFDTEDYDFLGYLIHHPPTYAFIENNETTTVDGMTFNTYRKSWRVDGQMNKQYLRGEFWYSDYELDFE